MQAENGKASRAFVSAVLLAAGRSARMQGVHKLLMAVGGRTLLARSVEHLLGSRAGEVLVVLGHKHRRLQEVLHSYPVRTLHNPGYSKGLSSSIRVGVEEIDERAAGVLLVLADQPNLRPATFDRLIDRFQNDASSSIVAAEYAGTLGTPALFHRQYFPELLAIRGDVGARSVIDRHPEAVATIKLDEEETLDVDTLQDFQRLRALLVDR